MNKLLLLITAGLIAFGFLMPSVHAADVLNDSCKQAPTSPVCKGRNPSSDPVVNAINTVANIGAVLTGIGAVIMIIAGGLTMATSAGNAENIAKARRRVIYSLLGLIVVALAWTIIHFVTSRLIQ